MEYKDNIPDRIVYLRVFGDGGSGGGDEDRGDGEEGGGGEEEEEEETCPDKRDTSPHIRLTRYLHTQRVAIYKTRTPIRILQFCIFVNPTSYIMHVHA